MPARIPRGAPAPPPPPDTCGGTDPRAIWRQCPNEPNAALLLSYPGGWSWLYLCPTCQDRMRRPWQKAGMWPPAERLTIAQAREAASR